MDINWTSVQKQRLQELNASEAQLGLSFKSIQERNKTYQQIEQQLVRKGKDCLSEYQKSKKRPSLVELENILAEALTAHGFVQVSTPLLLSRGLLAKMLITENHPLFSQVYWVDSKKCLRPMLAPNLYYLMKELARLWEKPVRIFEIGPCFRKDTRGPYHMNEFTMLNLVEMGLPEEQCPDRIKELAALVMDTVGITDYQLEVEKSVVYGESIDVMSTIELGSGAMGPHFLDREWGVTDPWVGIGFGLERLVITREGLYNIQKIGRSLTYLGGVRLNI